MPERLVAERMVKGFVFILRFRLRIDRLSLSLTADHRRRQFLRRHLMGATTTARRQFSTT
jgi:hypothetical protein